MLEKAQIKDGNPPHVLTLLDSFTLKGPNGTYSVLVTDIVISMSSLLSRNRARGQSWHKNAAHGLTQTLASLHATGIVHGGAPSLAFIRDAVSHSPLDLHIGNFGFAFPQIAGQGLYEDMLALDDHEIVLPICAAYQTPSLPAYVLPPCKLAKYYDEIAGKDLPQTKIFDFGNGESYFYSLTPHFYHSPNSS